MADKDGSYYYIQKYIMQGAFILDDGLLGFIYFI